MTIDRNKFVEWIYKQDINFLRQLNGTLNNLPMSAGIMTVDAIRLALQFALQLNDMNFDELLERDKSVKFEDEK